MKLIINRLSQDYAQTIGELLLIGIGEIRRFCSVELPWKENQRSISCIPAGRYKAEKEIHGRFGKCIRVHSVPGRSGILIHSANHFHQLEGCIAPGKGFFDIDADGHVDVTKSRLAMDQIYDQIDDVFVFELYDAIVFSDHRKPTEKQGME